MGGLYTPKKKKSPIPPVRRGPHLFQFPFTQFAPSLTPSRRGARPPPLPLIVFRSGEEIGREEGGGVRSGSWRREGGAKLWRGRGRHKFGPTTSSNQQKRKELVGVCMGRPVNVLSVPY